MWRRISFLDATDGCGNKRGGFPFLEFWELASELCDGLGSQDRHIKVEPRPRIRVAWTGRDVQSDFFVFFGTVILVSARAAKAFEHSELKGVRTEAVEHLGLAQFNDFPEEIEVEDSDAGSLASGFRQLIVEHQPACDKEGCSILRCPICGFHKVKVDPTRFSLEHHFAFPPTADIVNANSLGTMHFASDAVKEIVERLNLIGIQFFDLLNVYGELARPTGELSVRQSREWRTENDSSLS